METEPDFVALPAVDYSLRKALGKYAEGVPPKVAARALLLTETDAEALFQDALRRLKEFV